MIKDNKLCCDKCHKPLDDIKEPFEGCDCAICLDCANVREEEKASLEAFQREQEEYHNEGYSEVSCGSCNTKQWMLRTKPEGVCCECGNSFYNEDYDKEAHLKQVQEQRNKLNRQITTLKKATLN